MGHCVRVHVVTIDDVQLIKTERKRDDEGLFTPMYCMKCI